MLTATTLLLMGLTHLTTATPLSDAASAAQVYEVAARANAIDLQLLAANECKGQSCLIADVTGSSGKTPTVRPEGAGDGDIACIIKYNPSIADLLKSNLPNVTKQDTGISSTLMGGLNTLWRPFASTIDKGDYKGACAKNILIFAKGTLEPTAYGITVGPQLVKGWDKDWVTVPVDYNPDVPGDYCLGLPGGMVVRDMINKAVEKCPAARIFVSGYSQGAMVARNGVAYASDEARSHVKGVVTFGDPFQGSPIKGYSGPLKEYCKPTDGVCTGNFELGTAHLSYPFDNTVVEAQAELRKMAAAAR